MTQPCPSPVSAGPVWQRELCVQEGWAACSQSSGKHCRAEMVSDPVAPRPLWPLLGFTLKRSQSTRCCWHWCLCRGVQLSGSAVFPGERIINKCLSQHFPKGKYPSVPNQTPVLCQSHCCVGYQPALSSLSLYLPCLCCFRASFSLRGNPAEA